MRETITIPREADAVATTLAVIQDALKDRDLEATSNDLAALTEPWTTASGGIRKAKESDLLNPRGKNAAMAEAIKRARAELETKRAKVKSIEDYAAGVRSKPLEVPAEDLIPTPNSSKTLEDGGEVDAADILAPEED